jgi:hypothetical protein
VRRPIPARLRGQTLARGFRGFRGRRFLAGRFNRWAFLNGLNGRWYYWSAGFGAYVPVDYIDDYPPDPDDPDSEDDDPEGDDDSSQDNQSIDLPPPDNDS